MNRKFNSYMYILLSILLCLTNMSSAAVQVDRAGIQATAQGNTYRVQIPFTTDGATNKVSDLSVSLLDQDYQTLAQMRKKLFLLNGKQVESVALPVSANTPALEDCLIRIDLDDQIWIKRFHTAQVDQELRVIGQNEWIRGSQAAMRVFVTRSLGGAPIADAKIRISADPQSGTEAIVLAETRTGEDGSASIQFTVPESLQGSSTVRISAESDLGQDTLSTPVQIKPGSKVLLVTDKPVYQPRQLMHIRGLATHSATGKPIENEPVILEVYDGKGNKVFKKELQTSEFGIVSADFQLADEVNQGSYRVKTILGESETEKTVQVYEYVLPKFRVVVENQEKFYRPGDTVKGYIEGKYFFGKALDNASVKIVANCFDVGFNEFATVEGKTSAEGRYEYSFEIPDRLVGQPSFQGNTLVQMDVRVTDTADHEEQKIHTFHVATSPIQVDVLAESGNLVPGVENEVFLVASRPDGSVVKPKLSVQSSALNRMADLECDENGIATLFINPATSENNSSTVQLNITATLDKEQVLLVKDIPLGQGEDEILLRPDKGVYRTGESMKLKVLASQKQNDPVFLDIIKNGQTVATYTMYLKDGQAEWTLPLDLELTGTLTLNAYIIRRDGNMVRDTRQVVVLRSDDLKIQIMPDQDEYMPGAPATLKIAVTGENGNPVQAALGMHIVDESVYSLAEKEPGLAKVFFAIERELLQPKYEIHGHRLDEVVMLSTKSYSENANLSRALLAKLDTLQEYAVNLSTGEEKHEIALGELQRLVEQFSQMNTPEKIEAQSVEEFILRQGGDVQAGSLIDPWGIPYLVQSPQQNQNQVPGSLVLSSAGGDQTFGTADDIVSNYSPIYLGARVLAGRRAEGRERFFRLPMIDVARRGVGQRGRAADLPIQGAVRFGDALEPQAARPQVREMQGGMGGVGMRSEELRVLRENLAVDAAEPVMLEQLQALGYVGPDAKPSAAPQERTNELFADIPVEKRLEFRHDDAQSDLYVLDAFGATHDLDIEELATSNFSSNLPYIQNSFTFDFSSYFDQDSDADSLPIAVNGQVSEEMLRQEAMKQLVSGKLLPEQAEKMKDLIAQIDALAEQPEEPQDKAVRVRRFFPETLFYNPELITDEKGSATVNLAMADSITTWRVSAMANAKSGAIGDTTGAMKVFKPFFVDLDLPVALLQNDEVTLPVAVYNYLDKPQEVEVSLEQQPWFTLLEGELSRKIQIAAQEVTSVTYRIRADKLGSQPITVYAWGSEDNDAIGKNIEVRPNGEAQFQNYNGRLSGIVEETVQFPDGRIAGADRLFVKVYPGVFSQVVEGLDAILQMPYGCFEQTSSTTYPNILALDYMRRTKRITPEIEMKAIEYINLGYQRLLTFEIDGGGFQVFGQPPATRILSAYGLLEFSDMSEVYSIDPQVIERTKNWLLGQRNADGSWDADKDYAHAEMWRSIQNNKVLVTAYISLALAKAGAVQQMEPSKAYLIQHANEAKDAYTLAILCNALLALDPKGETTRTCLQRLVDLAKVDGKNIYWEAEASMSFARGNHASVEATAWATLALTADGRFHAELGKAINWLIEQKDPNGTWGTTHGTVLALKALLNSLGSRTEQADATITLSVDGKEAQTLKVTPENSDVFHQMDITDALSEGDNRVHIHFKGEGQLLYQIVGKYFVPWAQAQQQVEAFDISVDYDRTELRRNDTVTCNLTAKNLRPVQLEMVMIDLGIPPGFRVETPLLDDAVKEGKIAKYTVMSRQLLVYLKSMKANEEFKLAVPMKATLPMVAKAPETTIYEYYNPEIKQTAEPQELEVK